MGVSHPVTKVTPYFSVDTSLMTERKILYASLLAACMLWHWHSLFLDGGVTWKYENNTRKRHAQHCLYSVLCIPGFWLFWWWWDWRGRRKRKLYSSLGTCPGGCWGWPVPDLDIGPWISDPRDQDPGPESRTLHGEERAGESRHSGLSAPVKTALSRAPTPAWERRAGGSSHKHNMPGITVAPGTSRDTSVTR